MVSIQERIQESISIKQKFMNDEDSIRLVHKAAEEIKYSLSKGGKVLFCGNGGSASDSLHLTGEIIGRFQKEEQWLRYH